MQCLQYCLHLPAKDTYTEEDDSRNYYVLLKFPFLPLQNNSNRIIEQGHLSDLPFFPAYR